MKKTEKKKYTVPSPLHPRIVAPIKTGKARDMLRVQRLAELLAREAVRQAFRERTGLEVVERTAPTGKIQLVIRKDDSNG
ncbi:MAG: hypothetical protein ACOX3F_04590 [Kiritimatiellia bacterium]|jgi:hypothetical protein